MSNELVVIIVACIVCIVILIVQFVVHQIQNANSQVQHAEMRERIAKLEKQIELMDAATSKNMKYDQLVMLEDIIGAIGRAELLIAAAEENERAKKLQHEQAIAVIQKAREYTCQLRGSNGKPVHTPTNKQVNV